MRRSDLNKKKTVLIVLSLTLVMTGCGKMENDLTKGLGAAEDIEFIDKEYSPTDVEDVSTETEKHEDTDVYEPIKNTDGTSDISRLKDDDYIAFCRQDGRYVFDISTPEQLASAVYASNSIGDELIEVEMNILEDIDLDGYVWEPINYSWDELVDNRVKIDLITRFTINGNEHTIRNMYISERYQGGFLGNVNQMNVCDLNFENAYVSGSTVGILAGEPMGCYFENCHVQGETMGTDAVGTMIGNDIGNEIYDCTADVIVNGERKTDYLSLTAEVAARTEKTEEIWLDEADHPCRSEDVSACGIGWLVMHNGRAILLRNAYNECLFDWHYYQNVFYENGEYEVTLTQRATEGVDVPISNTVDITVDDDTEFFY